MVDFAKLVGWREPVEIYLAALGNPEPLALRVLDNEPFTELERRTLAHFLRGELKPPKRKRGQTRISYLRTIEDIYERIIQDAVLDYHHIMSEVQKEHGSKYHVKIDAIEYVAGRDNINVETLLNRINRPRKNSRDADYFRDAGGVPRGVRGFHEWLHRTGKLPDYPPHVSSVTVARAFIERKPDLDREQQEASKNDPTK